MFNELSLSRSKLFTSRNFSLWQC